MMINVDMNTAKPSKAGVKQRRLHPDTNTLSTLVRKARGKRWLATRNRCHQI